MTHPAHMIRTPDLAHHQCSAAVAYNERSRPEFQYSADSSQHCASRHGGRAGVPIMRVGVLRHPACSRGRPVSAYVAHVKLLSFACCLLCAVAPASSAAAVAVACIGMPPGLKSGAFRFIADCADCADAPTAGRICAAECIGPAEPPSQSARAADGPSCGCTNTNTSTSVAAAGASVRARAYKTTRARTPRARVKANARARTKVPQTQQQTTPPSLSLRGMTARPHPRASLRQP